MDEEIFILPIQSVDSGAVLGSSGIWQKALWPTILECVPLLPDSVWKHIRFVTLCWGYSNPSVSFWFQGGRLFSPLFAQLITISGERKKEIRKPDLLFSSLSSPQFYVTFWQLKANDIECPDERYLDEIERQKKLIITKEKLMGLLWLDSHESREQKSRMRKEKDKATAVIKQLQLEQSEQQRHVKRVIERLLIEKDHWLSKCKSLLFFTSSPFPFLYFWLLHQIISLRLSISLHLPYFTFLLPFPPFCFIYIAENTEGFCRTFYDRCIRPRFQFSPSDAYFCYKFILILHSINSVNFPTRDLLIYVSTTKWTEPFVCPIL